MKLRTVKHLHAVCGLKLHGDHIEHPAVVFCDMKTLADISHQSFKAPIYMETVSNIHMVFKQNKLNACLVVLLPISLSDSKPGCCKKCPVKLH